MNVKHVLDLTLDIQGLTYTKEVLMKGSYICEKCK